jgi:prevent-host-death family protein
MGIVGLRELRQNASELVRRAEEGEEITIIVAGRPGARLVPAAPRTWRQWTDLAELFAGSADPAWNAGRAAIADEVRNEPPAKKAQWTRWRSCCSR